MTERIWAPWRLEYIEHADDGGGCIFCDKPAANDDATNHIVSRSKHAFVMLNAFPYSNGHLMVAPFQHTADLGALSDAEMLDLFSLVRDGVKWLTSIYEPQGFNVGINLGRSAGAGVDKHVHIHIVPRWTGDTNFMAVVGDTRVIPEALQKTYERLKEIIENG